MRIVISVVFAFLLATGIVFAKADKNNMPSIKFNGAKYTLKYSAKSDETGGYLNEYYKAHQTYTSWTELLGLHHYPTAFYPIEHAQEFADYLTESGVVANVEVYDDDNEALLYFVVMDKHKLPIVMEFNIFKFTKSPVCGTLGFQYAKRYMINNPLEIEKFQKEIVKSGPKYIKRFSKLEVPSLVPLDIDNGKYLLKEGSVNNLTNLD